MFDAFKSGYHKLQNLKIWSQYQDLLQTKCEFLQKSFNPELAAQLNNQVLNTVLSFQDAIELDTLTLVMFEALQFTVPLESDQSDLPKWVLRDNDAQMQVKLAQGTHGWERGVQGRPGGRTWCCQEAYGRP